MKKTFPFLIIISFLFISCVNHGNNNQIENGISDYQNSTNLNTPNPYENINTITVRSNFKPTLKLTDKLKTTTLHDLIFEYLDNNTLTSNDWSDFMRWSSYHNRIGPVEEVPIESNLAKIYFLQDFKGFITYNFEYFHKIDIEWRKKDIEDSKEKWKEYL